MSVSQSKPYPQSVTKEKVDSKEAFANKTNLEDSIEYDYIGSAEGHEYPDLQVGDEVNPRTLFVLT